MAIIEHESTLRLVVFIGLFSIFAMAELFFPKKERVSGRGWRWLTNWLLVIIDSLILRLLLPIFAVGAALWAETQNIGLFHWLDTPPIISGVICFILLDLAIYAQHVASHKMSILWRIHKVHHSDIDLDVTSALRFHPIEIILSMLYKIALVVLLGAPAACVVIFEVILNGAAMFNHSNLNLSEKLDKHLRKIIVTPDMHRIHHSIIIRESDTNYGFNFSIWDKLFKTYTHAPEQGHSEMILGLKEAQNEKPTKPLWTLLLPFTFGKTHQEFDN